MKNNQYKKCCMLPLVLVIFSCNSFLTVDPPIDRMISGEVFSNAETATAAVRGLYAKMMSENGFSSGSFYSVTLLSGRSADEFTNYNTLSDFPKQFSDNNLFSDNSSLQSGLWRDPYQIIYGANSILESLNKSVQLSVSIKQQLGDEAKFIRALCYFYLTNLFGDVPLILSADYRLSSIATASNQQDIYVQIIKDLVEARDQLGANYLTSDRTRVNKWAATALLARAYLFNKDWVNAEKYSSELIAKVDLYELIQDDLNTVFLSNSKEAILQFFVPQILGVNTNEGKIFILTEAPGSSTEVVMSENLLNAFEVGDKRKSNWIGKYTSGSLSWYYPYKYKVKSGTSPLTEYSMVLRIAEQYLIRAEARTQQGNILGPNSAQSDVNAIRGRAGLSGVSATTQVEMLLAIEKERQTELFAEWGHRWLDLKRTNRADAVLGPLKGKNWQSTDQLYPIPYSELLNNKNLKQNPGYN